VAGRDRGFGAEKRDAINLTVARAYRRAMRDFSQMGTFELWYLRQDVSEIADRWMKQVSAKRAKRFERTSPRRRARTAFGRSTSSRRSWMASLESSAIHLA
jgi:hypothetical protein